MLYFTSITVQERKIRPFLPIKELGQLNSLGLLPCMTMAWSSFKPVTFCDQWWGEAQNSCVIWKFLAFISFQIIVNCFRKREFPPILSEISQSHQARLFIDSYYNPSRLRKALNPSSGGPFLLIDGFEGCWYIVQSNRWATVHNCTYREWPIW